MGAALAAWGGVVVTLTLYQFDYSPYCAKVRAVLQAKGLRYKTVEVLPFVGQGRLMELSGQRRVPVLVDGSRVISDSTQIAYYIDTAYPEVPLIPEGSEGYRACFIWEDWADEAFGPAVRSALLSHARADAGFRQEFLPPLGQARLDVALPWALPFALPLLQARYGLTSGRQAAMERQLARQLDFLVGATTGRRYLIGSRLSLADVSVATMARWLDAVPACGGHRYAGFFRWRDAILEQCLLT